MGDREGFGMVWDYAEVNFFSNSGGNWSTPVDKIQMAIADFPANGFGSIKQINAGEVLYEKGTVISSDPPYYDNIGYADLSDFFFCWLRPSLKDVYPDILARNRFVVHPIARLPDNVWGWTFFTVDESPYLSRHFVTEWQFGLSLLVRVNDRLFVFDTDGVPFDPGRIGVSRLDREELVRLFGPSRTTQKVRITKLAAASLEMSDRAIRTMTTRLWTH